MSVAEWRRRLVAATSTTDVYVSTIRLEPGLSGELQVIVTLETADVLSAYNQRRQRPQKSP